MTMEIRVGLYYRLGCLLQTLCMLEVYLKPQPEQSPWTRKHIRLVFISNTSPGCTWQHVFYITLTVHVFYPYDLLSHIKQRRFMTHSWVHLRNKSLFQSILPHSPCPFPKFFALLFLWILYQKISMILFSPAIPTSYFYRINATFCNSWFLHSSGNIHAGVGMPIAWEVHKSNF